MWVKFACLLFQVHENYISLRLHLYFLVGHLNSFNFLFALLQNFKENYKLKNKTERSRWTFIPDCNNRKLKNVQT